ncbi:hypothetical protein F0562_015114 [Nyssa sinensis]|uniref:Uncharacterized protein n=1 Tax=Nyssa sinensis TaxID=561372 RepID=A0A5J4ZIK1_9ASTE|nr:hypothetical protein F0562_015114 [Nyssa sinensis]
MQVQGEEEEEVKEGVQVDQSLHSSNLMHNGKWRHQPAKIVTLLEEVRDLLELQRLFLSEKYKACLQLEALNIRWGVSQF